MSPGSVATSAESAGGGRRSSHPAYGEGVSAIREAALAVAAERGLHALTLRGVAERAGVSHGLVRHHFGTRDALVAATVAETARRTMYLEIGDDTPLSRRIDRTLSELRVQYTATLTATEVPAVQEVHEQYRHEVTAWLTDQGVAADAATVLLVVAALDGLSLQRLSRGGQADVDGAFALLRSLVATLARE